jgi:hypothetical protein
MDKKTIEEIARLQEWKKSVEEDLSDLKEYKEGRQRREIVSDWMRTKCLWVWTILMGWCVTAGVYIADHYDKVSAAVVAAIKALRAAP